MSSTSKKRQRQLESGDPRECLVGPLLDWYRSNRRDLPWRRLQHDPYAVWVSEIMLQQTQVATAVPYYQRWMERFPTIDALAAAPLEEALRYWAGLGYYARARNLHRAAQQVVAEFGGRIPCDEHLGKLPGIGRYTQGAIRSIACGHPEPVVDANVTRVFCRLYAISGDPKSPAVQRKLWDTAARLVPEDSPGSFNQALMELGALVCTPAEPACERCPLVPVCLAGNSPDPTAWPETPPGRPTLRVTHASAIIHRSGCYLMILRPPHGLWGGLWEFPRRVCDGGEPPDQCAARAALEVVGTKVRIGDRVGSVRHSVTHHAITLHGFEAEIEEGEPSTQDCAGISWVGVDRLGSLPVSAPQSLLIGALREGAASGKVNIGSQRNL